MTLLWAAVFNSYYTFCSSFHFRFASVPESVNLDDNFNTVKESDQVLVLKYITKFRRDESGGVQLDHMESYLKGLLRKQFLRATDIVVS